MIDSEGDGNDLRMIQIQQLNFRVSDDIHQDSTYKFLNALINAKNENLQIDNVNIYVNALFELYWYRIVFYLGIQASQFVLIGIYILYFLDNINMTIAIFTSSILMLFFEAKQIMHNTSYFSRGMNYIDLFGQTSIIAHSILRFNGYTLENQSISSVLLISGVIELGLRSMKFLEIFKQF